MLIQSRAQRKATGGLYKKLRKRKKRDIGSDFLPIKIGDEKKKKLRVLGGNHKIRLLQANMLNLFDPRTQKTEKVKIITVKENPANPHFVRMNIITKNAIVQTEKGLARITNRPGQEGIINAIAIEEEK